MAVSLAGALAMRIARAAGAIRASSAPILGRDAVCGPRKLASIDELKGRLSDQKDPKKEPSAMTTASEMIGPTMPAKTMS